MTTASQVNEILIELLDALNLERVRVKHKMLGRLHIGGSNFVHIVCFCRCRLDFLPDIRTGYAPCRSSRQSLGWALVLQ